MFGWFKQQEEPNKVTQAVLLASQAKNEVIECVERINELMPLVKNEWPRFSLWIDRLERPHMLQLCDWEDAFPRIVAGGR